MSAMPVPGGPYLTAACFCDKVLIEQDGVVSLIRIVDRWNIAGPTGEIPPGTLINTTLFLLFRSGIHRGSGQVTITPILPEGEKMASIFTSVSFEGDDERGAALVLPVAFPAREAGMYWFEVNLEGVGVITYVPLRIVYLRSGPMAMPALPSPPSGLS
jgi:hypothetical protein